MCSSDLSGGIFTELSELVINNGGVVFGAKFDKDWNVVHDYTDTIEGLAQFRGSKYAQSKITNSFVQVKSFLGLGREVLFSGTPCHIAGLRRFLGREYGNLILVDIVCHGVPSPLVWNDYLASIKLTREIDSISFRHKDTGWSCYSFFVKYKGGHEETKEVYPSNIFIKGFLKDLYLRPSCYHCPAKSGKAHSDITIGDYWGINDVLPKFNDEKGVGLILLNTDKGSESYEGINPNQIETTYEQAFVGNPSMEHSVQIPKYRDYFWKKYNRVGLAAIEMAIDKMRPSFGNRLLSALKSRVRGVLGGG